MNSLNLIDQGRNKEIKKQKRGHVHQTRNLFRTCTAPRFRGSQDKSNVILEATL